MSPSEDNDQTRPTPQNPDAAPDKPGRDLKAEPLGSEPVIADLRDDPERTGRFKAEPVGGKVTDPGTNPDTDPEVIDREPAGPARPAWPGPTAASSVGQAGSPGIKDPADRDRPSWAGPTVTGPDTAEGPVAEQSSRPIPTTATPAPATAPVFTPTPTPAETLPPASSPTSSSTSTSEDEIFRPEERRDPSVREDYAHADADSKAGGTGRLESVKDEVSPVTPISSGRRRSDAAPDAVDGVTDLTSDTEWRDLQARFVDDPGSAVSEAATLLERDLAGLKSKLAGGSTEDLRNAFKRYRSLHESLR